MFRRLLKVCPRDAGRRIGAALGGPGPKKEEGETALGSTGEKGVSPDEVSCESQCPARKFSLLDQALTWFHVTPDIRG
jgi:hypothetical protein